MKNSDKKNATPSKITIDIRGMFPRSSAGDKKEALVQFSLTDSERPVYWEGPKCECCADYIKESRSDGYLDQLGCREHEEVEILRGDICLGHIEQLTIPMVFAQGPHHHGDWLCFDALDEVIEIARQDLLEEFEKVGVTHATAQGFVEKTVTLERYVRGYDERQVYAEFAAYILGFIEGLAENFTLALDVDFGEVDQ